MKSGCVELRTISKHDEEDDNGEGPVEEDGEQDQRDEDVHECRNDVEEDQLEDVVDSSPPVQDPQNLASLSLDMEGQREIEQVVECELRHRAIRVLHNRAPKTITECCDTTIALQEAENDVSDKVRPERLSIVVVLEGVDESTKGKREESVDNTA